MPFCPVRARSLWLSTQCPKPWITMTRSCMSAWVPRMLAAKSLLVSEKDEETDARGPLVDVDMIDPVMASRHCKAPTVVGLWRGRNHFGHFLRRASSECRGGIVCDRRDACGSAEQCRLVRYGSRCGYRNDCLVEGSRDRHSTQAMSQCRFLPTTP